MATAARIYWTKLNSIEKEEARKLIESRNGTQLIQLLRKAKALHAGGCDCNITPSKVLYNGEVAIKRKLL